MQAFRKFQIKVKIHCFNQCLPWRHCPECLRSFFIFPIMAVISSLQRALFWDKVHMMVFGNKTFNRNRIISYSFFFFPAALFLTFTMKITTDLALKLNMILHSESNAKGKAMKPWGFETLNNKRWKTSVRGCNVLKKTMITKKLAKISALPRSLLCIKILDKENNDESKSFGPQFCFRMLWHFTEIFSQICTSCCLCLKLTLRRVSLLSTGSGSGQTWTPR